MSASPDDGADIVAEARSWIGTPYRQRAALKGVGADCVGLIRGVLAAARGLKVSDRDLPVYSDDWAGAVSAEPLLAEFSSRLSEVPPGAPVAPGDVLCFRVRSRFAVQHCGICDTVDAEGAPRTMIHTVQGRAAARVHLSNTWRPRLVAVFRS